MKIKTYAWALMTGLALAACTDKNDILPSTDEEVQIAKQEYCLNAQLILPELMDTRAGDDDNTFANGDPKEWAVKNSEVYFEFFDEDGTRLGVRTPNLEWKDANADGNSVTRSSAELTISAQMKPKYLVVYVNVPDEEYPNLRRLSLKELKSGEVKYDDHGDLRPFRPGRTWLGDANNVENATFYKNPVAFRDMMLTRYANTQEGSFMMINSSYEQNGQIVRELDISDYLYEATKTKENMTEKQLNGIDIYVERVVAKVNTKIELKEGSVAKKVADNIYEVPQLTGSAKTGSFYIEMQGWQLNGTNKSFKPLKDIGESGMLTNLANGLVAIHGQGRSYWAYDLNYAEGENDYLTNDEFHTNDGWNYRGTLQPVLNYYTLANMKALGFTTDLDNTDYCFENTVNGSLVNNPKAVTHVLVRAQYKKKSGSDYVDIPATECIYRLGKTIYEESEVKAYALEHIKAAFGTAASALTVDDIQLVHNNNDFNGREDVKSHVVCEKLIGKTYASLVRPSETIEVPSENILRATDQKSDHKSIAHYRGDVTEAVLGAANLYTFERGVCYYTVPIRHFSALGKGHEGYHGVVRNHWYTVTIEDIIEFGHPATPGDPNNPNTDPGKPIIPEDLIDEDYALNARINVQAWAKKPIQAIIGGDELWK